MLGGQIHPIKLKPGLGTFHDIKHGLQWLSMVAVWLIFSTLCT